MTCLQNFRIATTQTGLTTGYFFVHKIPPPATAVFKGFTEQINQSQGQVQHGYMNVEITWTNVTNIGVYNIKRMVDAILPTTRILYLTVPYNDGTKPGERFIDVYGVPLPVDPQPLPLAPIGSGFQTLTLRVNALTVLNDPAVF